MSICQFSPQARLDLRDIHDYVAQDRLLAAARLVDRLEQACQFLADNPELGQLCEDLAPVLRCFSVDNYAIFYRPSDMGVQIVRVVSGARDFEALFYPEP